MGKLARRLARSHAKLKHWHVVWHFGTLARRNEKLARFWHVGTQTRWHVDHVGMQARGHAGTHGTQFSKLFCLFFLVK